jgi:hypothetical protein
MPRQFSISSDLAVIPRDLWQHSINPLDINAEFRPWLVMRFPRDVEDVTSGWQAGRPQFRCWIKLGGILPVEYDDLAFAEVEPGYYFLEQSSMLTQQRWQHRREIEPLPGGARITDSVEFTSRVAVLEPLFDWVFRQVFRWRHHNLCRMYGRLMGDT